jgi:hypothetical protein
MAKIAVILLADADRPEGMGRMANALTTAQEAKEAGDDVRLILDGAGTKWAGELAGEEAQVPPAVRRRPRPGRRLRVLRAGLRGQRTTWKRRASAYSTNTRATPASVRW